MAVSVPVLFNPTVLTAAAATIYTVPAAPPTLVAGNVRVRFTNTTAGAVSVTAYGIPSGGSAAAGNQFLNAVSIAGNAYLDVDVPALGPGGFMQALAGAVTSITVHQLNAVLFS